MNEEEAIERLIEFKEENKILGLSDVDKPIETVLNLIEKQKQQISNLETAGQALEKVYKAEIEKQKERIKYLERSISRKEHSLVEEEQDNVELETKLQEKDNIIDEMAEYISIIRDCPNEDKGANIDCENRCNNDDNIYKECWKIYFENKVKESK